MRKSRPPYPAEYRQQMVDLVRGGRTPEALSREFEPSAQSIWNWVRQAERDEGIRSDGLTTEEKEELRHLRREVRVLREEKEILKKAALSSTRQRNTLVQFFCRTTKVQRLPGTPVQSNGNAVQIRL